MLTCGSEDIPLDFGPNISVGRKLVGKKKEKEEKGERRSRSRAKLHLLSSFFGDRTVDSPSEQEGKFFLTARASIRDRNRGVSTNSKR